MVALVADSTWKDKLNGLNETTEIRDEAGRVLGFFTPLEQEERLMYRLAAAHFDPEEMQRINASSERTYTTAEVLSHLDSLGS